MSICGLAKRIQWLQQQAQDNPLAYFRPTRPQRDFIMKGEEVHVRALVGGNQIGKTICAAYFLVSFCLGKHPSIRSAPPVETLLVTHSHSQSRVIQEKLWNMIPKNELHPSVEFRRGRGFRGVEPLIRFNNGSIIRVKTSNQGLALAGSTCALVMVDEPVSEHVYSELLARTARGGRNGSRGYMCLTLTPVGDVDLTYLKELIDQGKIDTTYGSLSLEDTTPIGWREGQELQPLLTQEQIDELTAGYLAIDREQRIHGSLEVSPIGVVFDLFSDDMVLTSIPRSLGNQGNWDFCIGIDHGSTPGSQVALLVAAYKEPGANTRVFVLDEYVSGKATPEHHVLGILEMLKRNGVQPQQCRWIGDGTHHASRNRDGYKMSNLMLVRALEKILNYPAKSLPWRIRQVKKYKSSVYYTASLINSSMARKDFYILRSAQQTIKAIKNWTLTRSQSSNSRNIHGHKIDALRYAITELLDERVKLPTHIRIEG